MLIDDSIYVPLDYIEKVMNYKIIEDNEKTIYINTFGNNFDYSWIDNNPYVAHAFGGIEGKSYTNSLEAFQYNYEKGRRVFEVDISLTADSKLVDVHDWSANTIQKVLNIDVPFRRI